MYKLFNLGICRQVMGYAHEQLQVMKSQREGKIAGCAYAHETLADDMMLHVFKLLYRDAGKYRDTQAFDREVYPYFSAHGNYKDMVRGIEHHDGVEAVHAQREAEKIKEVIDQGDTVARNAYEGAVEFADRQNKVWDGMMAAMQKAGRAASASQFSM